jgi:LDH2 family malate/lactate/ureidoglycolate dehydrogenase
MDPRENAEERKTMSSEYEIVQAESLANFCRDVFGRLKVPLRDARTVAEVLVAADLRGIDSHGVARLRRYVRGLKEGVIFSNPKLQVVHETPVSALLDGGAALGQVAGKRGMETAISKALQSGAGFVAVQNSNHFGIAGCYSQMALEHDLIGIALTNSTPDVVPTFGREVMLGTNPISVAVPAGGERPYVLDMSTAVITSGKLESRSRMGKKIPFGWAVDEKGEPSDDPDRVYANMRAKRGGGLLPLGGNGEDFGGHKGYGLGLLVDIFSGVLSASANTTLLYPKTSEGKPLPSRVGHFFGALRVDLFRPLDGFKKDMDDLIRRLKNSPKAEGQERIYIHGEKEFELEQKYRREGIPLYFKVYKDLKGMAEELGIEFSL